MAKKERLNVVYSTNPDFKYEYEPEETFETLPPQKQKLYVGIEKNGRGGKIVTLVKGFVGTDDDLADLGKKLKVKCGTGGNVKDGDILVQGDFRDKIMQTLQAEGYNAKRSN